MHSPCSFFSSHWNALPTHCPVTPSVPPGAHLTLAPELRHGHGVKSPPRRAQGLPCIARAHPRSQGSPSCSTFSCRTPSPVAREGRGLAVCENGLPSPLVGRIVPVRPHTLFAAPLNGRPLSCLGDFGPSNAEGKIKKICIMNSFARSAYLTRRREERGGDKPSRCYS